MDVPLKAYVYKTRLSACPGGMGYSTFSRKLKKDKYVVHLGYIYQVEEIL
jgi:hypothetical protein